MISDADWAELQAMNAERNAAGEWSCVFDSGDDPSIPEGYGCGGCGCHLSAPCLHCTTHLPAEDAHHIAMILRVSGRATR